MGPTLGTIEVLSLAQSNFGAIWTPVTPTWLIQTGVHVFPYALFLALQAIISAALTSVAVTDITEERANVNRMLIAQGVGNMLSGGIGGLPIGSSPPQSVAAAKMSNINRIVPGASIMILLVVIAVLGRFLNYVPIAVLAGILVTSGIGLIDRWARTLVKHALRGDVRGDIKWNLCIVIAVAATFFFGSVPLALMVGAVLAMILLTINLSAATKLAAQDGKGFSSTRVWPPLQTERLTTARSAIRVVRPRGGLFFGTADQLADVLEHLDRKVRFCIIDFSQLTTVDATGCQMVTASAKKLAARGVKLSLAGLNPAEPRDDGLVHLGLTLPAPDSWYPDLDHALEAIETELLREHCGETITDTPVPLGDTTIANGLSGSELQIFREHLRSVQCDAGSVVCKTGEPGSSLYIVTAGEVEIRTSHEVSGGERRLAIFGPGCIFGEVALFTGGLRTADAVCTKRTTLHELTQEALRLIAQSFPPLHGKILANLNANLATRLVVATEIVRGQR